MPRLRRGRADAGGDREADTNAMLEHGGLLEKTCEACHRKYWY
jgi:hypothetical protein